MLVLKLAASLNNQTEKKREAELIYNLSAPAMGHAIAEALGC
jgi:hypothetical protein